MTASFLFVLSAKTRIKTMHKKSFRLSDFFVELAYRILYNRKVFIFDFEGGND